MLACSNCESIEIRFANKKVTMFSKNKNNKQNCGTNSSWCIRYCVPLCSRCQTMINKTNNHKLSKLDANEDPNLLRGLQLGQIDRKLSHEPKKFY